MKHKTFTFRSSWFEAMRNMSDASRLALMDAICRYAFDGELPDPEALDPVAEIAFMLIRAEIDAVTPQAAHPDRHSILNGQTPGYNA